MYQNKISYNLVKVDPGIIMYQRNQSNTEQGMGLKLSGMGLDLPGGGVYRLLDPPVMNTTQQHNQF